jgi:hypothetical protein
MKYLLLIPSIIAMLASVMFWVTLVRVHWPHRWQYVMTFVAAVSFQFSGIWIAGLIDK